MPRNDDVVVRQQPIADQTNSRIIQSKMKGWALLLRCFELILAAVGWSIIPPLNIYHRIVSDISFYDYIIILRIEL